MAFWRIILPTWCPTLKPNSFNSSVILGLLLSNMRQQHHIRALALAHWAGAKSPKPTRANIHNLAQAVYRSASTILLHEPKPHGFGSRRRLWLFLTRPSPRAKGGFLCEAR